jgi:SAM-dependent methyltransferase
MLFFRETSKVFRTCAKNKNSNKMSLLKTIQDFIDRKIVRSQKARWNHQYAQGKWDGLKDAPELERQNIIKEYFLNYKGEGNMIEFGCGFGVLPDVIFKKQHYSNYLGVDVSDFVIEKIQNLADSRHIFEVGDMENYTFKEKYDVIVFNEVINYAQNIPKLLADCRQNGLKDGGIFIISVHDYKRSIEHWKDIHSTLQVLESRRVDNGNNRWQVEVLK